jgi:hypothetical protein
MARKSAIAENEIIRLPTQKHRSDFIRNALREAKLGVYELAEKAELHPSTVARFTDLISGNNKTLSKLGPTRDPKTSTLIKIFSALGYEVVFQRD